MTFAEWWNKEGRAEHGLLQPAGMSIAQAGWNAALETAVKEVEDFIDTIDQMKADGITRIHADGTAEQLRVQVKRIRAMKGTE